jgi:pimeloyl-ACP methyl ester carboxylesterase
MKLNLVSKHFCIFIIIYLLIFQFGIFAKEHHTVQEIIFDNSHFKTVEGIDLHYRIWMPENDIPVGNVLLVHGLGGSTFSWRNVAPELARHDFLVIAVDLPGFGLSQRRPAFEQSHEGRANIIWELIKDLSIPGDWHLAGHSMGGGVAAAMALQRPCVTVSLTLAAGLLERDSRFINKLLSRSRMLRNIAGKVINRFFLTRKRVKSFLSSAYGREPTTEELEGYYKPLQLKDTYLTLVNLFKSHPSEKGLVDKAVTIDIPALFIWGREDNWVPVSKGGELEEKMPNSRMVIIDEAGHCPMETHPEDFNYYFINFLENLKMSSF